MAENLDHARRAATFWSEEVVAPTHQSWLHNDEMHAYVNTSIGGSAGTWPLDWFQSTLAYRSFGRALSIGSGAGALERDLIRRNICRRVDACDISVASLSIAGEEAERCGYRDRIRYFAADFNHLQLALRRYDIVFFHQSLHHVANLERLMLSVLRALKPNGLLYLDEYVGPSRDQWTHERLSYAAVVYKLLPRGWRLFDELQIPVIPDDPSEAVRSGDILDVLAVGFEILHKRDYGGNLLATLYPQIRWSDAPKELVPLLIDAEKKVLQLGAPSHHSVILARPRRGIARAKAFLRYKLEVPRLRPAA